MATLPIVVENANEVVETEASAKTRLLAEAEAEVTAFDEFGRTEAERTVILASAQADAINTEVELGKHASYDDALAHVLSRGFTEIERTRKASAKLAAQKELASKTTVYTNMLAENPSLITHGDFVAKMMAKLAELSAKAK